MPPHIINPDRIKPFATEAAFEEWLAANHASAKEVWIKIYKTGSGVPTITPVQAIDVALCWGWVDGVRKSLDETSFLQRYTPRKAKSVWSQLNQASVARLAAAGRITPHGQRHIDRATADGRLNGAPAPLRDTTDAIIPADLRAAAAGGARVPEQVVPERTPADQKSASPAKADGSDTPKRPAPAKAKPAQGKVAAPKRPAAAKAKPVKGKAAAPKRPAAAKAKPVKGKVAAPKRPAAAKAKPAKGKAAAPKRPAKATRAAKASSLSKPPRKAKAKKAPAPASKKTKKRR
jgi:uncharacterized protein YdeI (YjbR/CyaY-like superfamily)